MSRRRNTRKQRLDEVQQERDKLASLVNNIPYEIWFADIKKKFTLANPAAVKEFIDTSGSLETSVEKLASSLEVMRPDGSPRPVEEAPPLRALKGEVVRDQEEIIRTPATGELRYRQVSATPVKDKDGNIIGSVSVVRDITEKRKTEEALRENEAVLKSFFDSPGIMRGIVEVINGTDIRHIRDNVVTASYMGLTPTDLHGKLSSELGEPAERMQTWLQYYKQSQTSGQPVTFEYLDKQGSKKSWLQSTVSYMGIASSGNPRFAYVVIDTTERKKLEIRNKDYARHLEEMVENRAKEVQTERKRLYSVLETLPAMICLLTPDHHVVFSNRSFRERFGESQGRYCYDYCFGNKEPCDFCESYKVLETGKPHHWEVPCPDGSVIDAYDFPFTDTDGSHLILEMDIDITEQKRMQKSLRSTSQYARSLIEASLDPLVTISAEGKITDVNEATVKVTGIGRQEIIGTDFSNYFTEPEKAREGYQKVFTKGYITDYPLTIRSKDGRLTDVHYNATIYKDEAGEIQGVFAAARDVTEHNVLERKLKDAERLAGIGATAGMVGHDIRNPLQGIEGAIYLGKEALDKLSGSSGDKAIVKEMFEAIEDQTKYINKIVLDLQDYARPLNPEFIETPFKQLIDESLSNVGEIQNVEVFTEIEDDAANLKVDPALMRRVLVNLITNSLQSMPEGGKLIIRAFRKGGSACISLQDTGAGIPEDVKTRLFQPMFTTKSKGQGFGLAVCKRIVEAHNGEISFHSEVDKGTIFTIQIPIT